MSEAIKPDLVLTLTRAWFAKIWNGEKRTEYRAVKPYWTKRIGAWVDDNAPRFILFQIGYAKDGPRLLVQTTGVDVGPCPYPGWRGDFYRIRFEIVQPYMRADGVFYPMMEMPRMKEKGGKARIVCRFTKKQVVEAFQNGPNGPDINDPIFYRSPYTDNCNRGDCERHKLGAEPCAGCPYCDEEGNI